MKTLTYVTSTTSIRLDYKANNVVIQANGKMLAKFDSCCLFDLLQANMKVNSRHPGIRRRAKSLAQP